MSLVRPRTSLIDPGTASFDPKMFLAELLTVVIDGSQSIDLPVKSLIIYYTYCKLKQTTINYF